jgi:filamentous hemagglutinin
MCIGTFESRTMSDTVATTAVGSTVGSIKGNVTVVAGNRYTQTGSDVVAPAGDIRIVARDVAITEAREVTDSRTSQATRQAGITLAVTSPALAAIQSTVATTEAIGNTGSGWMKALGVASAAMNLGTVAGGLQEMGKNPSSAANVSISLRASQSSSRTTAHSDSAKGSTVAGRNVAIVATGGGQASDILVRGSDITGTKSVTLAADSDVSIVAAQSTSEQHSQNSSSAASVGLSIGTQGIMFTASASGARGHADGSDVTQVNSHVGGGELVTIRSGGDTTLAGGVVAADRVVADIGGDLKIRSLQDTAKFDSKQQSLGGSVSVGMGAMSGSVSISRSRVDADYASVREQSGIQAGDGGFDVKVKGNIDLIGGVVASSQAAVDAGRNRFDTASLTTANIQNRDDFNASGFSLGGGYGTGGKGNPTDGGKGATPPNPVGGVNGASPGFASASGHVNSTTTSGVSGIAGNADVRTGDSSGGIAKTFDAAKVNREIGAQLQITSTFLQQAASAWGSYANKRMVDATTPEERACWGADGACRVAGHAVIAGLGGGIGAAIGTAASTGLASQVDAAVSSAGLTGGAHDSVVAGLSAVIGVATGGAAGAAGH